MTHGHWTKGKGLNKKRLSVTNNLNLLLKIIHFISKGVKKWWNFEREDIHKTYFTTHGHWTKGLNKKRLSVTNNIK